MGACPGCEAIQSLTQDSRDFSHERNVQEKLVFDMSPKLVSKNEASGGSQNCTLESSFAAVQFAHDSSSRIVIYLHGVYRIFTGGAVDGLTGSY